MNEERMPVTLYTLDLESGHEMTADELKKQKKHDIQPWIFLICICVLFGVVLTFLSAKLSMDMAGMLVGLFVLVFVLAAVAVFKIMKISRGLEL